MNVYTCIYTCLKLLGMEIVCYIETSGYGRPEEST